MIEQKEIRRCFVDLPDFNIQMETYKNCARDYFNGVIPWGSPFHFLSHGITYDEMLYFAKFSIEFMDFLFDFLFSEITGAIQDRIIDFLADAWLTEAEITERIEMI